MTKRPRWYARVFRFFADGDSIVSLFGYAKALIGLAIGGGLLNAMWAGWREYDGPVLVWFFLFTTAAILLVGAIIVWAAVGIRALRASSDRSLPRAKDMTAAALIRYRDEEKAAREAEEERHRETSRKLDQAFKDLSDARQSEDAAKKSYGIVALLLQTKKHEHDRAQARSDQMEETLRRIESIIIAETLMPGLLSAESDSEKATRLETAARSISQLIGEARQERLTKPAFYLNAAPSKLVLRSIRSTPRIGGSPGRTGLGSDERKSD